MSIPKTMRAVRIHGVEDYRMEEVPVPEVGRRSAGARAGQRRLRQRRQERPSAHACGSDEIAPYIQPPVTPGHGSWAGRGPR